MPPLVKRGNLPDQSPFEVRSLRKAIDIHLVRPELVAEVEIAEFTSAGMLRQATFKLREDFP